MASTLPSSSSTGGTVFIPSSTALCLRSHGFRAINFPLEEKFVLQAFGLSDFFVFLHFSLSDLDLLFCRNDMVCVCACVIRPVLTNTHLFLDFLFNYL